MLSSNAAPAVGGSTSSFLSSDIAEAPKVWSRAYQFWPSAGAGRLLGLPVVSHGGREATKNTSQHSKRTPTPIFTWHCKQIATNKYIDAHTEISDPREFRAVLLQKCKYTFLSNPGLDLLD